MMTHPLYLEDAYKKEMSATILSVEKESPGKWKVILDQTVFYPMGGGQPTDQGHLLFEHWMGKVYQVLMKGDQIVHYVAAETIPPVDTEIKGIIDWERRYLNMRLHSGGHIVDFALFLLGLSPTPLTPWKGDHGKKPMILYQGVAGRDFKDELEAKANDLVNKNLSFSHRFAELEELQKSVIYLQPGLPTNKPLRILTLESVGSVADGGTQVHKTGEVGPIRIPSIDVKEGVTTVKYALVSV